MLKPIIVITFSIFLNFSLSLAGDLPIFKNLLLSCNFETGTIPKWANLAYTPPEEYSYKCYTVPLYQTFKFNLSYKFFYFTTAYTFYTVKNRDGLKFTPYKGTWPTDVGIKVKNISVEYSHKCEHTITYIMAYQMDKRKFNDMAYDKFSVTFHISNKQFY